MFAAYTEKVKAGPMFAGYVEKIIKSMFAVNTENIIMADAC